MDRHRSLILWWLRDWRTWGKRRNEQPQEDSEDEVQARRTTRGGWIGLATAIIGLMTAGILLAAAIVNSNKAAPPKTAPATTGALPSLSSSALTPPSISSSAMSSSAASITSTPPPLGPNSLLALPPIGSEPNNFTPGPATVKGKHYDNTLIVDPGYLCYYSSASYQTDKRFTRLHALVGATDTSGTSKLTVHVYTDSGDVTTDLAEATTMVDQNPVPLNADISGQLRIRIAVEASDCSDVPPVRPVLIDPVVS